MRLILLLLISVFFTNNIICQDSLNRKNSISISLLPLLDRTYSLTYCRKLNKYSEISLNPRFRVAKSKSSNDYLTGPEATLFPDPWWYYNRFFIRSGLLFRPFVEESSFQGFFVESTFQYDYGFFKNIAFLVEDHEGDMYDVIERIDRSYNSWGLIGFIGYINDSNFLRFKLFTGFGVHNRYYGDRVIQRYNKWTNQNYEGYPKTLEYEQIKLSIHLGVELGINF